MAKGTDNSKALKKHLARITTSLEEARRSSEQAGFEFWRIREIVGADKFDEYCDTTLMISHWAAWRHMKAAVNAGLYVPTKAEQARLRSKPVPIKK